jgi:hypothetical protein
MHWTYFCIHSKFVKDIFSKYPMLSFTIPNLGYKFSIIIIFMPLWIIKKVLNIEFYLWTCLSFDVFGIITSWTFFVCVSYNNNVTFLFWCFSMDIYHVMVMAFRNSLWRTIKVVLFHGSSNKLTFKLDRKRVFNESKFGFKIFLVQRFSKKVAYSMSLFCFICFIRIILFGQT